jgi:hypothetical protein
MPVYNNACLIVNTSERIFEHTQVKIEKKENAIAA